jgi:uncharacterized protein DUF5678
LQEKSSVKPVRSADPHGDGKHLTHNRGSKTIARENSRKAHAVIRRAEAAPFIEKLKAGITREIHKRFAGKHVAIIDNKVIASVKSPMDVWKRAKKLRPQRKPVLAFVLKDGILVLNEEAGTGRKSYYGSARAIGPFRAEGEMKGHE